jgi:aminoglycoside phosphotransferase
LIDLLTTPEADRQLGLHLGPDARAASLSARRSTFQVSAAAESYVVRLAQDRAHLADLRREARIAAALQGRTALRLPDTRVVEGEPAFALHKMIPGKPLTTEHFTQSAPAARERLVGDLARFFRQMHGIPLRQAGEWLDIAHEGDDLAQGLAPRCGKPLWFAPDEVAAMRPELVSVLDARTWLLFERTVAQFEALAPHPEYMVFGHGDLHGYNAAVVQDDLGPRLVGVFDLENTGILDVHEDFFRLSLVSEAMLDDVLAAYQHLPGPARSLDRARIAVYYRAFLFYLMVGKAGERLAHLHGLLTKHLDYCCAHDIGGPDGLL